jgi:hypothetical protein
VGRIAQPDMAKHGPGAGCKEMWVEMCALVPAHPQCSLRSRCLSLLHASKQGMLMWWVV